MTGRPKIGLAKTDRTVGQWGLRSMSLQIETGGVSEVPHNFFELGLAYSTGREGRVDLVEAHKWFNIAAARGDRDAAKHREELASEMSRSEIAAALRAAREWLSRSAVPA
jgi:TPR repeat protein